MVPIAGSNAGYQEILDEKASLIADGNVLVVK